MALVQATMLSGRYRTQSLLSHWHKNINGCCLLAPECRNTLEDIDHILQICPGLLSERNKLLNFTRKVCSNQPDAISNVILEFCHPEHPLFVNFLLDSSSIPEVISVVQSAGKNTLVTFFDVSRMWVFVLQHERLRHLGRWKSPQDYI